MRRGAFSRAVAELTGEPQSATLEPAEAQPAEEPQEPPPAELEAKPELSSPDYDDVGGEPSGDDAEEAPPGASHSAPPGEGPSEDVPAAGESDEPTAKATLAELRARGAEGLVEDLQSGRLASVLRSIGARTQSREARQDLEAAAQVAATVAALSASSQSLQATPKAQAVPKRPAGQWADASEASQEEGERDNAPPDSEGEGAEDEAEVDSGRPHRRGGKRGRRERRLAEAIARRPISGQPGLDWEVGEDGVRRFLDAPPQTAPWGSRRGDLAGQPNPERQARREEQARRKGEAVADQLKGKGRGGQKGQAAGAGKGSPTPTANILRSTAKAKPSARRRSQSRGETTEPRPESRETERGPRPAIGSWGTATEAEREAAWEFHAGGRPSQRRERTPRRHDTASVRRPSASHRAGSWLPNIERLDRQSGVQYDPDRHGIDYEQFFGGQPAQDSQYTSPDLRERRQLPEGPDFSWGDVVLPAGYAPDADEAWSEPGEFDRDELRTAIDASLRSAPSNAVCACPVLRRNFPRPDGTCPHCGLPRRPEEERDSGGASSSAAAPKAAAAPHHQAKAPAPSKPKAAPRPQVQDVRVCKCSASSDRTLNRYGTCSTCNLRPRDAERQPRQQTAATAKVTARPKPPPIPAGQQAAERGRQGESLATSDGARARSGSLAAAGVQDLVAALRERLNLPEGQRLPQSLLAEFPQLAPGTPDRYVDRARVGATARPAARDLPPRPLVKMVMDFHDVLDDGHGRIPDERAGPVQQLIQCGCLIYIYSFLGWDEWRGKGRGRRASAEREFERFCRRFRLARTPDYAQGTGALVSINFCNTRAGPPEAEHHMRGQLSTGGKDWACYRLHAPLIVDDHAGTCIACAAIGVFPLLVRAHVRDHHARGCAAHSGLRSVAAAVAEELRDDDRRRDLIERGLQLLQPERGVRHRVRERDASQYPSYSWW